MDDICLIEMFKYHNNFQKLVFDKKNHKKNEKKNFLDFDFQAYQIP